ncbi:hypothetical protein ACS0TY_025423 [Phlomoides rotata]
MASLFLLASLALASIYISQADLISDICKQAVNPSLCTQTLTSDPRSRGADLKGLGQIAIEKGEAATHDAIGVVMSFSGKFKAVVETCVETFNNAIDNLKESSQALNAGRKGDVQAKGSGALSNAETCDDEFGESEPAKVKKASKRAQDIIDILLVIANKL